MKRNGIPSPLVVSGRSPATDALALVLAQVGSKPGPQHRKVLEAAVERREDRDYRSFLLRVSPSQVRLMFADCFAVGPRRGGAAEALQVLNGDTCHPMLLCTVPVIEECERFMPGFGHWLGTTGYGDDIDMIRAFAKWYELGVKREYFRARMHA